MDTTIASITRAFGHDVDALNVVSQNIANMRTPGYRAERLEEDFSHGLPTSQVTLDGSDGPVLDTGRKLDVALQGNGYFLVADKDGTYLSRDGAFNVDSTGQLVDAAGHAVLGESGPIRLDNGPASIRPDGQVVQNGQVVDRLRVVTVRQPGLLRDVGQGLYAYAGATTDWTGTLRTGALEEANVDPGGEMVHLMEITRHAQALQHAMQAYDEVMHDGISQLGTQG